MRIIIIGIGKVGKVLTEYLTQENHDVVIIDKDPKVIQNCVDVYDVLGVVGNGASYDVQMEAGAGKADVMIATTDSDELNILCCLVGKRNGVPHTIARVRNPEYSKQVDFLSKELGLSMIVNPEFEAAKEVHRILKFPSSAKIDVFANGQAEIVELKLPKDSPFAGKTLADLRKDLGVRFLIGAVERENQVHIPGGSFVLNPGDKIYLSSSPEEINALFKKMGIFKQGSKSVLLVGGGKISFYLCQLMIPSKVSIKIVEMDPERCRELSEAFPEVVVIEGDGTDQDLLIEEGIGRMDAVAALTGIDEENIIISMFAENLKVRKVVTKVNHYTYTNILEQYGLNSVISPKLTTANHILRFVRSLSSTVSQVKNVYKLVNHKIEASEFLISAPTEYTGIPLRDLPLKENFLIACIVRDNQVLIPGGDDRIEPGDSVVVVTTLPSLSDFQDALK